MRAQVFWGGWIGETEELFEYAHVLLFATAIMYVKEIAFVARSVNRITNDFHHKDTLSDERVLWIKQGYVFRFQIEIHVLAIDADRVSSLDAIPVENVAFAAIQIAARNKTFDSDSLTN